MVKLYNCTVMMSQLRTNVLDSNGEPVIVKKKDMLGAEYSESQEKTYRRGDIISLPEAVIKKLGKSVEMVMVPQIEEPVEYVPEEVKNGEFKDSGREKTVAEIIPKEEKGSAKGKGNK